MTDRTRMYQLPRPAQPTASASGRPAEDAGEPDNVTVVGIDVRLGGVGLASAEPTVGGAARQAPVWSAQGPGGGLIPGQRVPAPPVPLRKVRHARQAGSRVPLPAQDARPQISRDTRVPRNARRHCWHSSLPDAPRQPAYHGASVNQDTFPGKPGHNKAPWTIRQDHPGGKAPATGTHHAT